MELLHDALADVAGLQEVPEVRGRDLVARLYVFDGVYNLS